MGLSSIIAYSKWAWGLIAPKQRWFCGSFGIGAWKILEGKIKNRYEYGSNYRYYETTKIETLPFSNRTKTSTTNWWSKYLDKITFTAQDIDNSHNWYNGRLINRSHIQCLTSTFVMNIYVTRLWKNQISPKKM